MKSRILGACVVFAIIFSLMISLEVAVEIADDQSRGATLPRVVEVISNFAPISFGVLIYPLLGAFAYFLNEEEKELKANQILWSLIGGFASMTLVAVSITALGFLAYLNGPRPLTQGRVIGNIIIVSCLLFIIAWPFLKKTKSHPDDTDNPVNSPENPKNQPDD